MSHTNGVITLDSVCVVLKEAFRKSVAFRPIFADLFGKDLTIGMYLSQAYYWCCGDDGKSRGWCADGWIYKTCDEFQAETYLSRRQQDRVRSILRSKAWWHEKVAKVGSVPKFHYRIERDLMEKEIISMLFIEPDTTAAQTHTVADLYIPSTSETQAQTDLYDPYKSDSIAPELSPKSMAKLAKKTTAAQTHTVTDLYIPSTSETQAQTDLYDPYKSDFTAAEKTNAQTVAVTDLYDPSILQTHTVTDLYTAIESITEITQYRSGLDISINNLLLTCHTKADKENTEVSIFDNNFEPELAEPKISSSGAKPILRKPEMTDLNLPNTNDRAACRTTIDNTTTNTRPTAKREDPNFGGNREFKLQVNWGIDNELWRTKEEFTAFKVAAIAYLPKDPIHGWRKDPAQHLLYSLKKAMSNEDESKQFILDLWAKYSPDEGIAPLRASWRSLDERKQRWYQRWINEDIYWQWQRGNIPGWVDKVLNQPNSKHCTEAWDVWVAWQAEEEAHYAKMIANELALQAEIARQAAKPPMSEVEIAEMKRQSAEFTAQVKSQREKHLEKERLEYEATKPEISEFERVLAEVEAANYAKACIENGWDIPTAI